MLQLYVCSLSLITTWKLNMAQYLETKQPSMAIRPENSSIGNYTHNRFIVCRALASAILLQPSHVSLRSGSSLGVETEREPEYNPTPSFLAAANMDCGLSVR